MSNSAIEMTKTNVSPLVGEALKKAWTLVRQVDECGWSMEWYEPNILEPELTGQELVIIYEQDSDPVYQIRTKMEVPFFPLEIEGEKFYTEQHLQKRVGQLKHDLHWSAFNARKAGQPTPDGWHGQNHKLSKMKSLLAHIKWIKNAI